MKTKSGFLLVEVLMATAIFSLAGSAVYSTFSQGVIANQKIHENFKTYGPLRIFFIHLEKDLRNSISLKNYPFSGKKEEISFPVFSTEEDAAGNRSGKIRFISYFKRGHELVRREEEINTNLKKEKPKEKTLLRDVESIEFQFPYRDEEENHILESFWLEEPYAGIPRMVKLNLSYGEERQAINKWVSMPQGYAGRIQIQAQVSR